MNRKERQKVFPYIILLQPTNPPALSKHSLPALNKHVNLKLLIFRLIVIIRYSQLRLIEPPVNRFLRLIGSKQPGPEVALLSGVDCILLKENKHLEDDKLFNTILNIITI